MFYELLDVSVLLLRVRVLAIAIVAMVRARRSFLFLTINRLPVFSAGSSVDLQLCVVSSNVTIRVCELPLELKASNGDFAIKQDYATSPPIPNPATMLVAKATASPKYSLGHRCDT